MSRTPLLPLSMEWVVAILFAVDLQYHVALRGLSIEIALFPTLFESIVLAFIFFVTRVKCLERPTLCYLAFPYVLFFAGWLNWYTALLMLSAMLFVMYTILARKPVDNNETWRTGISGQEILAFVLIVIWVNLSGAGGLGYQSADYAMHNGRLEDLITQKWPVEYSNQAPLVYYVGYYLPAAAFGKLFGLVLAMRFNYLWTILGASLALRWFCQLTNRMMTLWWVLVFAFFGSQDILGFVATMLDKPDVLRDVAAWPSLFVNTFSLDFWMPVYIGGVLSNTFQLYWAPHQIIAGWLVAAFTLHALIKKDGSSLIFCYALLCLWSPLIMLAFAPCVFVVCVILARARGFSGLFSIPNVVAALVFSPLFLFFYASGSALINPHDWVINHFPGFQVIWLLVFFLFTWGLYALLCIPSLLRTNRELRIFFVALLLNFVLLSLYMYGVWSDLLCRGSAPLSYCLLVFVVWAWQYFWQRKQYVMQGLMVLCFVAGSGSALVQNKIALEQYGEQQKSIRGDQYSLSFQFLGSKDSFFGRHFRKPGP